MNREQLLSSLQQSLKTLTGLPDPGHELDAVLRRLRGAAATLSQPRFRVGLFGVASSGKSALLNAFAGEPLLPERSPPSSNVPVRLCAGASRSLTVHRLAPGAQPEQVPATPASLEALGTIAGNPGNCKAIRLLELTLPQSLIPPGIELEESPGLGAGADRAAETLVRLELLPRADIVLYLLAAGRFSSIDREMFSELHPDQPVICVLTGADRYPPEQLDAAAQQVQEYLPGTPVVRINAKLAQNRAAGNWESSGFPALLAALEAAARQAWDLRIQGAAGALAEVAHTLRPLLAGRLGAARATYDADKARHDSVVQALERLAAARAALEHEIGHLTQFTPSDQVLEPVEEWLGRLQVPQSTLEPALRELQKRLDGAPATYRAYVNQRVTALANGHTSLSGLRQAVIRFPDLPPLPGISWPTVNLESRSAFGLLKQRTAMILVPQLQEAVERAVRTAVAPLQQQVARDLRAWSEQILDDRMATWKRSLPEAAARLAAAARPLEQLAAVNSYWQPLAAETERVAAAGDQPKPETAAMARLVNEYWELALPRLLLRAVHDVAGSGRSGRRRVALAGGDFARQWQLARLLLRQRICAETPAAPATGLLWLQTPARSAPPPFPCDPYPVPEHRLLERIDLVLVAAVADPGDLAAAAQWADAVIWAAPASTAASAIAAAGMASYAPKAILVLSEAGALADRLPELAVTLAAWRAAPGGPHPVILHDGHDVRCTHFLALADRAETPSHLARLWRAQRLRPGPPFDSAALQGYFVEIQAGRNGGNA